ncbi:hypothetical protein QBC35DRAFT_486036 [Podospora australis]|uniref:Zn(2)-C6 fungal-type domain-containing protein n=1 Tax=Podospora australis TaxID=1536484 RepID=A0AAN6X1X0_9PEZI|nr:hypothetical protein QBC35DRAFT_486036 [Podospora australis]
MSAASSPTAPSPQPEVAKASRVCLNCKRKKKRCDKALPRCGRCAESMQACQHEEDLLPGASTPVYSLFPGAPSPIGSVGHIPRQSPQSWIGPRPSLLGSIRSAETIDFLAFQSLHDVLENRQGVEFAVSAFFQDPSTWFTIVDRVSFEINLADLWTTPSAETSVLVLCMNLITQPQVHDAAVYQSIKALLSLITSSRPMSITLMQAELLVAGYETFNALQQQQAYLTIGRCFQMSRAFGWHQGSYWSLEKMTSHPKTLKLHSILWWATVYLDLQLHIQSREPKFPQHTSTQDFDIPIPETFNKILGVQVGGDFLDSNSNRVEGILFPEANSALYLSNTLQQFSNPLLTLSPEERERFSGEIWDNTIAMAEGPWSTGDRSAAVATNLITVLKLNQPGLLAAAGMGSTPGLVHGLTSSGPVKRVRDIIDLIHNEAVTRNPASADNPTRFEEKLALGWLAPSWAFAVYHASLLLITHGETPLQDATWLHKVQNLRRLLETIATRWKIAEQYVQSLDQALQRRRMSGYVA